VAGHDAMNPSVGVDRNGAFFHDTL
jgi:hypothetical protein